MKKFLKKNLILIVICLILFGWGSIEMYSFKKQHDGWISRRNEVLEKCKDTYGDDVPVDDRNCQEALAHDYYYNWDTISVYFYVLLTGSVCHLQMLAPIFVIVVAVWQFNKELKSGYFKNILMRMRYTDYLKKSYLKVLKYSLIFPIFLIFMFILAYLISGHFNFEQTLLQEGWTDPWLELKYVKILPQFIFVYFTNFILHSIFWINIGFIMSKRSHNVVLTIISSFLMYIAVFIVTEIFIGGFLLSGLLGFRNVMDYFSLSNIWVYEGINHLWLTVIYALTLVVISLLVLICVYKNKEGVINENEG